MDELGALIQQLDESGKDVGWQGPASSESVDDVEALLGARLPASFRNFLCAYGGGGLVEEEISGIEANDPTLDYRGTLLGDTRRCRDSYGLPGNLVVIYLGANETVWCLDVDRFDGDECPVVSYDFQPKKTFLLNKNFTEFFKDYLRLRISR